MNTSIALAVTLLAPAAVEINEDQVQLRARKATTKSPAAVPKIAAPAFTARISATPDINQHMTWAQFLEQIPVRQRKKYTPPAEIGVNSRVYYKNFCGPCSVADNLLYLRKFYPQIGEHQNKVVSGTFLARSLGSSYLSTLSEPSDTDFDPVSGKGTSVKNIVKGTLTYLKEKNVPIKKVTVISVWSPTDSRADFGHAGTNISIKQRPPSTQEIKTALTKKSMVVTHYGHYDFKKPISRAGFQAKGITPYLRRSGGHYVAPVGFGKESSGKLNPDMFIFNDPAGSDQDEQKQIYFEWARQPKGEYQNIEMLNYRGDKGPRHPSFKHPTRKTFELIGSLNQTYVMDKPISNPKINDRFEVMESLICIEVQ
jgi:hypothetical protein